MIYHKYKCLTEIVASSSYTSINKKIIKKISFKVEYFFKCINNLPIANTLRSSYMKFDPI